MLDVPLLLRSFVESLRDLVDVLRDMHWGWWVAALVIGIVGNAVIIGMSI